MDIAVNLRCYTRSKRYYGKDTNTFYKSYIFILISIFIVWKIR